MIKNKKINCICEKVYVETNVDTDGDNKYDLIAVYIKRPESTLYGEKVPVIYVANPYLMTCNEDWYSPHDVDKEVKIFNQQNIKEADVKFDFSAPIFYENIIHRKTEGYAENGIIDELPKFECISELYEHLNQRGYGTVFCGGLGTRGSEGFTITGSREEVLAFKAVIDWLNGRCRAFTNKTDNIEVKASWCTGNVAMSAKSYLGTMCYGVATTGVEGLKTIIPEAGITNWYEYFRGNGLNIPAMEWQGDDLDILAKYCFSRAKDKDDYSLIKKDFHKVIEKLILGEDRDSANYNKFWDERNYLNLVKNIKASVFIIHGINDWNVKTNQCFPMFELLEKYNIPRKIMAHQGEHIYIYGLKDSGTIEIIDRWLDHYLLGIENDIENEPKVLIQSNIDQKTWLESDTWPPTGTSLHGFNGVKSENFNNKILFEIVDDLSKTVFNKEKNNLKEWRDEIILSENTEFKNRVKYIFSPVEKNIRISGPSKVSFSAMINQNTAIFSAMLVDLGDDLRTTSKIVEDENGEFTFAIEDVPSKYKVITRGHLNAQNRNCNYRKDFIEKNVYYDYEFEMVPTDHSVKAGHKLALIIYGIDAEETQRPTTITEITIKQNTVKLQVPYSII